MFILIFIVYPIYLLFLRVLPKIKKGAEAPLVYIINCGHKFDFVYDNIYILLI